MIEIKMPKEIRKYREKLLFGLTLRQLLCTAAALLINVPLYFYLSANVNKDLAGWVVIFIAIPFAGLGFVKYNGMSFERLVITMARFFWYPQKRSYHTENIYAWIAEEIKEAERQEDRTKEKGEVKQ